MTIIAVDDGWLLCLIPASGRQSASIYSIFTKEEILIILSKIPYPLAIQAVCTEFLHKTTHIAIVDTWIVATTT